MTTTNKTATQYGDCAKCDGRGRIDAFSHIAQGVCFWCSGSGKLPIGHEHARQTATVPHNLYSVTLAGKTAAASQREGSMEIFLTHGVAIVWDDGEVILSDGIICYMEEHCDEAKACNWTRRMKAALRLAAKSAIKVDTFGWKFDIEQAY